MEQQYEDEWLNEQFKEAHQSIFNKQILALTNTLIQQNIEQRMKHPIYNISITDLLPQQPTTTHTSHHIFQHTPTSTEKTQALFDPLQDQDNQAWVKKHFRKTNRPLSCPACFTQIAFNYTLQKETNQQCVYCAVEVCWVEVKQNIIVRQKEVSEVMLWEGVQSRQGQKLLKEREEQINIKIVVQCSCGLVIGYYDINKQHYVLTNVI